MSARTTTRSADLYQRLQRSLPGGDTRSVTFRFPYPVALERGSGYRVWDVDGNEYFDLNNNNTSLIHGHLHPRIMAAVHLEMEKGVVFPSPNHLQAEMAERLRARIPSVERVRFTNSGTEAVMYAIRAARAFTGRERIVKADLGYNGGWEQVPATLRRSPTGPKGPRGEPAEERYPATVPRGVRDLVRAVPFNDLDALQREMEEHGHQVAALLFSPYLSSGGGIPGDPAFFRTARRLADEYGALLVYDEVISLRLAYGGFQEVVGVKPDLVAMGKIIGGGFPVGAFGGREDIMAVYDPSRPGTVMHSGTFNGNPISMAAGLAALDLLTAEEINRINRLGTGLARHVRRVFDQAGLELVVAGYGSIIQFQGDASVVAALADAALDLGLFVRAGLLNVSTPMDDAVVAEVAERLGEAAARAASLPV